jgi:proline iminopeptidase
MPTAPTIKITRPSATRPGPSVDPGLATHYLRHADWRAEGQLLDGVDRIAATPAVLIHGRLDLSSPLDVAWKPAKLWAAATLHIVADVGHTAGGAVSDHMIDVLDRFASESCPRGRQ